MLYPINLKLDELDVVIIGGGEVAYRKCKNFLEFNKNVTIVSKQILNKFYDLKGNIVRLDDGTVLEYLPWKVELDISNTPYEQTAGARMKKYEVDETATKDGKLMENDIVLFRYADVLLMKSEAKVRNGEDGDAELNEVRGRVNASSRTATLENILAERQLELAWEGWRRQDLIRFGAFTRAYNSRPQLPDENNGYTTVFPIPEKIRVMNTKLEQNPGY